MTYLVNQFPDNLEVLVQQSGHQNEFIKELAIFQSAVEFIKKEYDGKAQDCLKGEDVKMSTFMKFLDYLDTPLEEGTYKYAQMGKICNRFQQENEEIMPLTIQPIYILNRQKGNAKKIEEMEDMILKTDTIKEQYDIILQDIKENETKAKEQLGDRYIEPDENFLKEKAIAILYFQALQTHMAQECKIEDDSSAVNVLTKYSLYRPRENGRIESNIESIAKFLKLLPKESQNDLLALFNKDSIEELEKLKNDKNFLDKIDAII